MPELGQLRTFAAVTEALSFTRAAEELGLSQQAASKARAGARGGARRRAAGADDARCGSLRRVPPLLRSARDLLARAEVAFAEVRDVDAGLSDDPDRGFAGDRLDRPTDVARASARTRPALGVAFHEVRPGQLRALLRTGDIDIALTRARGSTRTRSARTSCGRRRWSAARPAPARRAGDRARRPTSRASGCSSSARRARRSPTCCSRGCRALRPSRRHHRDRGDPVRAGRRARRVSGCRGRGPPAGWSGLPIEGGFTLLLFVLCSRAPVPRARAARRGARRSSLSAPRPAAAAGARGAPASR